jgi:hypothetical protein
VGKFTHTQRTHLRQLIVEAEIQRFSRPEAKTFVETKFGQPLSYRTYDKIKQGIKLNASKRLDELKKSRTAYIDQYFQRIDEILKYQEYQWRLYHSHPDRPLIQKLCLQELHALTVTLANLYDALPAISEIAGTMGIDSQLEAPEIDEPM